MPQFFDSLRVRLNDLWFVNVRQYLYTCHIVLRFDQSLGYIINNNSTTEERTRSDR